MNCQLKPRKNHKYVMTLFLLFFFVNSSCMASAIDKNPPLPQLSNPDFDKNGIRLHDYKGSLGKQYNPLFICNDALDYYSNYFHRPEGTLPNPFYKEQFFKIVIWLLENSEKEGNIRKIPYKFDILNQTSPWYSGITQARAAKVFMLAYNWEKNEEYIKVAEELVGTIFLDTNQLGFTYNEGEFSFFEEYTEPTPNHVLNAHMSILVNLHEIKEELEKADKNSYLVDLIDFYFNKGLKTLKSVLPLYENLNRMNLGLSMQPGDFFSNPHVVENTSKSYDLIHLCYLKDFVMITEDEYFKDVFYKYYTLIGLSADYKKQLNTLSNIDSIIIEGSDFPKEGPHALLSAFNNFYKIPTIYAASSPLKEHGYFVVDFGKIKEIEKIEMRFHWGEFPRNFSIFYQQEGKWIPLCEETNWSSGPEYEKKLSSGIKARKIKFVASNFSNQKRILLDYMYIYEPLFLNSWEEARLLYFIKLIKENKKYDIQYIFEDAKKRYNNGEELFNFSFLRKEES